MACLISRTYLKLLFIPFRLAKQKHWETDTHWQPETWETSLRSSKAIWMSRYRLQQATSVTKTLQPLWKNILPMKRWPWRESFTLQEVSLNLLHLPIIQPQNQQCSNNEKSMFYLHVKFKQHVTNNVICLFYLIIKMIHLHWDEKCFLCSQSNTAVNGFMSLGYVALLCQCFL